MRVPLEGGRAGPQPHTPMGPGFFLGPGQCLLEGGDSRRAPACPPHPPPYPAHRTLHLPHPCHLPQAPTRTTPTTGRLLPHTMGQCPCHKCQGLGESPPTTPGPLEERNSPGRETEEVGELHATHHMGHVKTSLLASPMFPSGHGCSFPCPTPTFYHGRELTHCHPACSGTLVPSAYRKPPPPHPLQPPACLHILPSCLRGTFV